MASLARLTGVSNWTPVHSGVLIRMAHEQSHTIVSPTGVRIAYLLHNSLIRSCKVQHARTECELTAARSPYRFHCHHSRELSAHMLQQLRHATAWAEAQRHPGICCICLVRSIVCSSHVCDRSRSRSRSSRYVCVYRLHSHNRHTHRAQNAAVTAAVLTRQAAHYIESRDTH
jgi:hypothetical protein